MSIANKQVYPRNNHSEPSTHADDGCMDFYGEEGLTFREALILQLAGNSSIVEDIMSFQDCADNIIKQADAIIKELEKEND